MKLCSDGSVLIFSGAMYQRGHGILSGVMKMALTQSFTDNLKIAGNDLASRVINNFTQPIKRVAPPSQYYIKDI